MTVRAGEKDEPPVDLMGWARSAPRDTRKRRIRAGEHKIRRMDLKGFERIVTAPRAFGGKVSPSTYVSLLLVRGAEEGYEFERRVD